MVKTKNSFLGAFALLMATLAAGCGRGDLDGLVRGQVLLDGRPLAGAAVVFSPVSGERASVGVTDANGQYELEFTGTKRGAFVGQHKVTVTTESLGTSANPEEIPERVPLAFTRRESTPLEKTVVAGRQTIDIEIGSE